MPDYEVLTFFFLLSFFFGVFEFRIFLAAFSFDFSNSGFFLNIFRAVSFLGSVLGWVLGSSLMDPRPSLIRELSSISQRRDFWKTALSLTEAEFMKVFGKFKNLSLFRISYPLSSFQDQKRIHNLFMGKLIRNNNLIFK